MFRSDFNSAIIEPYYDGGDSYTGHHKYSCIMQYHAEGDITLEQEWDSAIVTVPAGGNGRFSREIAKCDLSIYDTVNIFMVCPDYLRVQVYFDDDLVFDQMGAGESCVQHAPMKKDSVTKIEYHVYNTTDRETILHLHYLGAAISSSPVVPMYTGNWEGCFAENPDLTLFNHEYMNEAELDSLKNCIKKEPYRNAYEKMLRSAEQAMKQTPEQWIAKNVSDHYRGGRRFSEIQTLAFVGLLEQNEEMMRMACRYALCLSACTYWGCDPMENVPYAVWHHRSFFETAGCASLAVVLSFCGNILTWHGRNILYNAIIMKGLPRIEADFMTMEYIYKMNQGLAFMEGYTQALICLCDRYPRFEKKLDLAEQLFFEMIDAAQNADGSTDEGGAYWNYTWFSMFYSAIPMARKRGKTLSEYIGDRISKTAEYGKFLLQEDGGTISVSDCGSTHYSGTLCTGMYMITGDPTWAALFRMASDSMDMYTMIYGQNMPNGELPEQLPFADFKDLGLTSVYSGGIRTILISGKSNVTHCHSDKGSFFVYKNGKCMLADRGTLSYELADGDYLHKTEAHNAAAPLDADGKLMDQIIADGVYSPYTINHNNGAFEWESDHTVMWDNPVILKNTRTIVSAKPGKYEVTDTFEFTEPHAVAVFYHIPADAADEVSIEALTDIVSVTETEDNLIWDHRTVKVLRFTTAPACSVVVKTKVTLLD